MTLSAPRPAPLTWPLSTPLPAPLTWPRSPDGAPAAGLRARAMWLEGGRWPLFAMAHDPARAPAGAIVLCPPLFEELPVSYPLYSSVAHALAEEGMLALRFHYEGTGNSAGPPAGPDCLIAWLEGIDRAVTAARSGCDGPLVLLGVRSGALMAAAAAARMQSVDAVVLWDPWKSGRSFLRHERALWALHLPPSEEGQLVEVAGGFEIDAATADAIAGLSLPSRLRARRALLVVRPDSAAPTISLEGRWRDGDDLAGGIVEVLQAAPGDQETLFEMEPLRRRTPATTAAAVVRWTVRTVSELGPPEGATVPVRATRAPHLAACGAVTLPPATPQDATVRERAVRIGAHGLFGIETVGVEEPSPARGTGPVVLFLSSGTDPHMGPARLWVTLARRWAPLGVRCIRVDLSGLGESAPRTGRPAGVVRAPEAFDDVAELVEAVGGPGRAILVGLCSGAYQALESALELHPLAVLGVNPLFRFTPPEMAAGGDLSPRRKLCIPRLPWESEIQRRLPSGARRAAAAARRGIGRLRPPPAGPSWLEGLGRSGTQVYLLSGRAEALGLPAPFDRAGGSELGAVRVEVVHELDHALFLASQRRDVIERLTEQLRTVAALSGPAAAGLPGITGA